MGGLSPEDNMEAPFSFVCTASVRKQQCKIDQSEIEEGRHPRQRNSKCKVRYVFLKHDIQRRMAKDLELEHYIYIYVVVFFF